MKKYPWIFLSLLPRLRRVGYLRIAALAASFSAVIALGLVACAPSINLTPDAATQSGTANTGLGTVAAAPGTAAAGASVAAGATVVIDAGTSGATATGTLSISLPAISPLISSGFSAAAARSAASDRAYFFATGAQFVLKNSGGTVVDSWSALPTTSLNGAVVSIVRQIPAGGPYTLELGIFNANVSLTDPVVSGTASGITVVKDGNATAQVYCIPNTTLFPTTLVPGTPITRNLLPLIADAQGAILTMGGEAWYKIIPSAGKTSISISHDYFAPDIGYAMVLYDAQGRKTGFQRFDGNTNQGSLIATVVPGAMYYLGIALRDDTAPSITPYTLTLIESTPPANLSYSAIGTN